MPDGSVRLDVDLSTSKAEKQLQKVLNKIESLETTRNKNVDAKQLLGIDFNEVGAKLDDTIDKVNYLKEKVASTNGDTKLLYKGELQEALEDQRALTKEINRINSEYDRLGKSIQKDTDKIEEMKKQAGLMQQAIEAKKPAEALSNGISNAKSGIMTLLKYGIGIRSLYRLVTVLRNGIVEGFREFSKQDKETADNILRLKNAVGQLKGAWGAAFAPIVNAVIPYLLKLINWLTEAGNSVARFIAMISGKSTYKRAVGYTQALSDGMSDVAEEAEEARKMLMGIDELTILDEDRNNRSGSGSKSKGGGTGGVVYEDALTNIGDGSFSSRLAMTIKDVFFDWGDWNAEKILQKAIAFIPTAAGAYIGWKTGGFKGAVIGGLLGLAFGLVVDSNSINGDGKLDLTEIIKSVLPEGVSLLFAATGHPVLGLALGLLTSFTLDSLSADGTLNFEDVIKSLLPSFAVFLGMATGHPVIGIAIGALISLLINPKIQAKIENGVEAVSDALEESDLNKGILTWQERARTKIQNFVSGVFGEEALAKLRGDGENLGKSGVEGFNKGVSDSEGETEKQSTGFFARIVSSIKEFLGIHSPSTVFADIGMNLIDGLLNGVISKWESFKSNISGKFEGLHSLISGIIERTKNLFNFEWKIPHIKLPHLSIYWEDAGWLLSSFGISSIPHLSVDWYAKGGIVDGATLIGAGEAGREAIVPLERNTDWINFVADGLVDRLMQSSTIDRLASALSAVPMPAMANGTVIPPNATNAREGLSEEQIYSLLADVKGTVMMAANLIVSAVNALDLDVSIDGLELARRQYANNERVRREHGDNMFT